MCTYDSHGNTVLLTPLLLFSLSNFCFSGIECEPTIARKYGASELFLGPAIQVSVDRIYLRTVTILRRVQFRISSVALKSCIVHIPCWAVPVLSANRQIQNREPLRCLDGWTILLVPSFYNRLTHTINREKHLEKTKLLKEKLHNHHSP